VIFVKGEREALCKLAGAVISAYGSPISADKGAGTSIARFVIGEAAAGSRLPDRPSHM